MGTAGVYGLFGEETESAESHISLAAKSLSKRVLDVFAAAAALILFAPLFGVLAIAIRPESPGPILFRQQRTGLAGRPVHHPHFSFDART
jgi:lipopolysaccharide/colanic/teichoic acid biosynthesis glycosyltransferase